MQVRTMNISTIFGTRSFGFESLSGACSFSSERSLNTGKAPFAGCYPYSRAQGLSRPNNYENKALVP